MLPTHLARYSRMLDLVVEELVRQIEQGSSRAPTADQVVKAAHAAQRDRARSTVARLREVLRERRRP